MREEYCTCESVSSVHTGTNDWYIFDICDNCNKVIEDSIQNLNHYDGEDHYF